MYIVVPRANDVFNLVSQTDLDTVSSDETDLACYAV